MLKRVLQIFCCILVLMLSACDTEDTSHDSDHPKFPDTSNKKHNTTSGDSVVASGGAGTGGTSSSSDKSTSNSNDEFEKKLDAWGTGYISECKYHSNKEIRIDKTKKTIREIEYKYEYNYTYESGDPCNSSLKSLQVVTTYNYTQTGDSFNSATIINVTFVSAVATILNDNYAESANTIRLYNKTGWKTGVEKDISSYIGKYSFVSDDKLVKIKDDKLYMDTYYEYIMPENYDITTQGEIYTKIK